MGNFFIFAVVNKQFKILLGPILAIIVGYIFYATGNTPVVSKTAGVLILMAYWWMTEAVNIYVTSLMPVVLFPLLGIMGIDTIAPQYMKDVIFLYIGGFMLTFAIERWNLHKRFSLRILLKFGSSPEKLIFGFMAATFFISMWLNNTSTTLMMLPVALAVIKQIHGNDMTKRSGLATAILLAISYASTIGGTATLVGTLPNMVMKKFYDENFQDAAPLDFANWFLFAFPLSIVFLGCCFLVFKFILLPKSDHQLPDNNYCKAEYQKLGKMSFEEKAIAIIFSSAILLWFTLDDKDIWGLHLTGWKTVLLNTGIIPDEKFVNESFVAILMGMSLFFFPSKNKKGETLISWEDVKRLPLGILFLFGGGFALAKGVEVSGLSLWIANNCAGLKVLDEWVMILALCVITTIFSEFASNTATVSLFMAILIPIIPELGIPPLLVMMPVTIAASFSFMLPVGTPPNTIVFGTELIQVKTMLRVGLWLDLIGAVVITAFTMTLGKLIFGI